ncbi:MAG TPA: T9SS type A sorting domain-containing protein [Arachidicoccus soli]|nr:T9SS type A sorting domain-containing protein [Arachidicoccus soli]
MMKYLIVIFFCLIGVSAFEQQGDGGTPMGINQTQKMGLDIPIVYFGIPNIAALRAEDKINDSLNIGPWRFGYNYETDLNCFDNGIWINRKDGGKTWLLQIEAKKAKTINLTFSNSNIPKGNELYIYNPDKTFILGKFTQKHLYKGELGAELVLGHSIIVEYDVAPENYNNIGNIEISRVTYGYRTEKEMHERVFGSSEVCEMNVNCPDGAPYVQQRNSAVMLVVGSSGFCSGALINNSNYDGKPYVLTANHCTAMQHNYASWIFRFKWQAPGCTNPSTTPPFESISGAVLRAKRTPSDFCLVEIAGGLTNGTVPQNCSPYFAGWNRSNTPPPSTYCIHHPKGDITKISFDDDPPVISQGMGSTETNSTWKVTWDRNTATEIGSSGSPLFNNIGQIIGQLWGGSSDCNNTGNGGHDYYGRIHNSWNPIGSDSTNQLEYWLDPNNSGTASTTGYDPYNIMVNYNAAVINVYGFRKNDCRSSFSPAVVIQNRGNQTLTTLTINYTYNGQTNQTYYWTGSLTTYQSDTVLLPSILNIDGNNSIQIAISNPNGQPDEMTSNDNFNVSYVSAPSGVKLAFTFFMGCYPDENSWEILDENNNVVYSGVGSTGGGNSNYYKKDTFCLPAGCYRLVIKDSYGDGVHSSVYTDCSYDGSMTLISVSNNDTLAALPVSQADFKYEKQYSFCIGDYDSVIYYSDVKGLKVYPNPNNGAFTVVSDAPGEKQVLLYSVIGQKVLDFKTDYMKFKISSKKLAAGVYHLILLTNKKKLVRKIVVK